MMTRKFKVLSVLAIMQLLLVAWMWWPDRSTRVTQRPVISFLPSSVESVEITGEDSIGAPQKPIQLERSSSGNWLMKSMDDFPARADRVEELLSRLSDMRVRTPIATNAQNHTAFNVDEKRFGRKIQLTQGEAVGTFYIGKGEGNSVTIRVEGSNDVYVAHGLTLWKISSDPADYIERLYFDEKIEQIRQVRIQSAKDQFTFNLDRPGELYSPDLPEGLELDLINLDNRLNKLMRVVVRQPLGTTELPSMGMDKGTHVEFLIERSDGTHETLGYTIGTPNGPLLPIKRDDSPFYIAAGRTAFEPLLNTTIEHFIIGQR